MTEQELRETRNNFCDFLEKNYSVNAVFNAKFEKSEPPTEPIKLADWLIDRGLKDGVRLYGKSDLRKLANYLLIYCGDEND